MRLSFMQIMYRSLACLLTAQTTLAGQPRASIVGWGAQVVGVDLDRGFVAVAAGGCCNHVVGSSRPDALSRAATGFVGAVAPTYNLEEGVDA
jgi:hypothetical protein